MPSKKPSIQERALREVIEEFKLKYPEKPFIIIADDDADLTKQIAVYAYENFLKLGRGMVEAKRKRLFNVDGSSGKFRAELLYKAKIHEESGCQSDIKDMVAEYDPRREVVLHMLEANGNGRCTLFQPTDDKALPETAYKTALKKIPPRK